MKLVMMIPLRRCGSNAIRLRMNLHPNFYSPYPLHLVDMMNAINSYGDLEDDNNYFRLIVDLVALQAASLVKWPDIVFDPVKLFKDLQYEPRSVHRVYGEMLSQLGKKRGVDVIMDKCQDSVYHYEEILELFPDMLFLDVVRDPRAQISSMNKAILYDFDTMLNTIRWVKSRKCVDEIRSKHPDKVFTIRYEDFVEKNEETMRRICEFLQIPFDKSILDVSQSNEALSMSIMSPLWETNYSPPNSVHIHKFTKYLNLKEITAIENMTLPWIQQYGYETMTKHDHGFFYDLDLAIELSEKEKKNAWSELKKIYPQDYILRKARLRLLRSLSE